MLRYVPMGPMCVLMIQDVPTGTHTSEYVGLPALTVSWVQKRNQHAHQTEPRQPIQSRNTSCQEGVHEHTSSKLKLN